MSERIILSTDANQIRNLADAMRDLERILASAGISRELEAISGSLAQMTSLAQAPVSALGTLNGTLMGFASLAGATAAIYSIRNALNTLGTSPKIAIAAVVIGGITAAINLLASAFGRGTGSANDFAEALANGTSGLDTRLDKLKRLRDLYEEQARLTEEWTEAHRALDGVLGSDELIATHERFTDLGEALTNVNGEMTALQEVVGTYNKGQIEAAIQTAIMEGAIEDAAEAISSLKAAYQEAYDAALTSINSQLGLFDRMNFEASKAVTEMASTWGYQAEDIQKHNENLQFAIQSELLPGVVSSFADINQAGNLDEIIASIREAGDEMVCGGFIMTEEAQAIVDSLNSSFEEQLNAREALADTIAGMQVDLETGGQEIIQNFTEIVEGLDLSDECRAAGVATIQGLIEGMQSQEGALSGQVSGLGESILSEIKSILNMNSPSRAMAEIGEGAVAGLIQGAESKQGDLSSAYEGLGKAALDAMESASNPQARSVGETIGDTTVDGATSVNYSAIPDAITSAIDGGRGNVNSSVDALVSDIERNFQTMKEQCSRLAQDMMTQMHTAITTKTTPIHGAVDAVKTGVVNGLTPLQTDIPRVTTEAMNGAYLAFSNGANRLIERARATAAAVAAIMASTLQVNSPSRVMIDLFSNVMDGIYVGMERGEDTVLKKAGDIADKLANTLTLEPDLIDNMVCKMQAIVRTGVISSPRNMLVPAGAVAGKGTSPVGTTHNHTYNTYVTSPKPLSEYQISRQIENMSRRMQRQL